MTGGMTLIHPMNALKSIVSVSWGIARTNDDSPLTLEERFFMGGSNSMRGFARNQVGPANSRLWTDFDFPEQLDGVVQEGFYEQSGNRWVPTGGDSFALANLELHLPIGGIDVDTASVVLFTDIGRLQFISSQVQTDSINQQLDPLFRYSTGVGFRYGTVIGPIAFDLGINPQPLLERGEVYFVPHLSFGSL
jgi:outer membrane protein assembly factor BamA